MNWSLVNENELVTRSSLGLSPDPPPPTFHLDSALPLSNSLEVIPQDPVIGGTNATQDLQDLRYPIESYPNPSHNRRKELGYVKVT
jgi:hypothetical protein